MPCTNSEVVLDGITLDLDPEDYVIFDGIRRGSIHRLITGSTIFQDRGFDVTDMRLTLKGKLTELATVQALVASYRLEGNVFQLTDFKGNDFQCIFTPGEKSLVLTPIRGSGAGWTYSIQLCVISATSFLSSSFPPPA